MKQIVLVNLFLILIVLNFAAYGQIETNENYHSGITSGLDHPIAVYNNWSAYDELSDNIPLTEELAMLELNELIRLKSKGVRIDYYVMDAFWFDRDGGYRTWNKKNWRNGPSKWLEACKKADIQPGLWFSTNLIVAGGSQMLNVIPEWNGSLSTDRSTLSLFEGEYLNHLMETLQQYVNMGFKMFKFDFAYFDAATSLAKQNFLPEEIVELNKKAFISAIKLFRAKNPGIIFIGFNGFGGDMDNTITPFRKTVDPRWLEIFDTMYSGDPRISDVPMMNFWRSQDLYSDHMVRQYLFNGLPLSRIDNCAFMIGKTGTCYNRADAAWKGALILTLARGGWLNVYHGNLELLDDNDAAWFAKVQHTYMQLQQYGQTKVFGAVPGTGMPYGYSSEDATGSIFTMVNPSQSIQKIKLSDARGDGFVIYHDKGFEPVIENGTVSVGAEQLVVVGFGKFATDKVQWVSDEDIIIPQSIKPLEAVEISKDIKSITMEVIPEKNMKIRVLFSQCDDNGIPFRSWGGAPPSGTKMNEYFTITARQGKKILPVSIQYDKMIWCGLSWGAGEISTSDFNPEKAVQIECSAKDGKAENFKITFFAVN